MGLLERALAGTVCTAKRDIGYGNRYPYHISKGAHFQWIGVDRYGVLVQTGSVNTARLWPWYKVAQVLIAPGGSVPWEIQLPIREKRVVPLTQPIRTSTATVVDEI